MFNKNFEVIMKNLKTLTMLFFVLALFVNCTDNSMKDIEQIEQNAKNSAKNERIFFVDPDDDGEDDDDPRETR